MNQQSFYVRHPLASVDDGAYQTFGDMAFYPSGGVRLGGTWFAYGTAIHRHRFGANLVAMRGYTDLNALDVETPQGGHLYFRYRPLFRKWHQMVEVHDPRLHLHRQRYGRLAAAGLYYLRWGVRWAAVQTLTLCGVSLLGALFVFAVWFLDWLF